MAKRRRMAALRCGRMCCSSCQSPCFSCQLF